MREKGMMLYHATQNLQKEFVMTPSLTDFIEVNFTMPTSVEGTSE